VRLVRLSVEGAGGGSATVRLRYLGRHAPPLAGLAREVVPIELPAQVEAGSRTKLAVQVRNSGTFRWSSTASLPDQIGARIVPLEAGTGTASEPRFVLPRDVAPGEGFASDLVVEWPTTPGRYRVSLDLVVEDLTWFADQLGAPLASGEVEVIRP
jgi:hypothetical protein